MDYIKIKFSSNFDPTGQSLGKTIQDVFRPRPVNPMFSGRDSSWVPQMDIFETPEEIMIHAEIAGVEKNDLDLEINSRAIKIAGVRRGISPGIPNSTYRLAEIQYGRFERILYLPAPVDTEVVSSTYTNGLLKIRIAKLKLDTVHKVVITEE
ncbi:Hsp20/alpha crystallin family protein [Desulfosarcina sp. OttesenSCG-928-G10]|nr:Hsp20/alpha crystallin family protein [Desulfosarcina sp. OttesenSCG-928-G10]